MPSKIVKLISKHKKNRKQMKGKKWNKPLYSAKIGMAECIVKLKDGSLVTRHMKYDK